MPTLFYKTRICVQLASHSLKQNEWVMWLVSPLIAPHNEAKWLMLQLPFTYCNTQTGSRTLYAYAYLYGLCQHR